jgi:hypothetical protein
MVHECAAHASREQHTRHLQTCSLVTLLTKQWKKRFVFTQMVRPSL